MGSCCFVKGGLGAHLSDLFGLFLAEAKVPQQQVFVAPSQVVSLPTGEARGEYKADSNSSLPMVGSLSKEDPLESTSSGSLRF